MATEKTYGPEKPATLPVVPPTDKERAEQLARQKDPVPTPTGLPKTPREALERERLLHPVVAVAAHLPTDFDEPFKVAEPRELTPAEQETKKQKDELVKQISEILGKFDHRESNIPANHEYWALVAKFRAL